MKPVLSMLAGAALLTVAGTAMAQEPVTLTSADLDRVTAGFEFAEALSGTMTAGDVFSESFAIAVTSVRPGSAVAFGESGGIAASLVFGAASESQSLSVAALD